MYFLHSLYLSPRKKTEDNYMKKNLLKELKRVAFVGASVLLSAVSPSQADACTGITLKSKDGSMVVARTIEWGGSYLNSRYAVVPRGYVQRSYLPGGQKTGLEFKARYGYVGFSVEQEEFVVEGLNEAGLSAGLFYFPNYGKYEDFDVKKSASSLSDLQLVPWILASFGTVEEVEKAIKTIHVVASDPRASTVHWRMADASGRQVVLEIVDGEVHFYENKLGVLTNAPGFEWHLTNLNNYVNLFPGSAAGKQMEGIDIAPFGGGSGLLGIPGDFTPPSRFVRAAFFQAYSPKQDTAQGSVRQAFQILNNFDIPLGVVFHDGEPPVDMPSATQWTAATDITNRCIYFRTMYDSKIRSIDLKTIDFSKAAYRTAPLDKDREQPIVPVVIDRVVF